MLFRYKLEGHDADWQDAGTRRQAYYGGLAPKQYRFRVMACNNDGVWNEAGATWSFTIMPAYYQTAWFRVSVVAAFLGVLWGLYRLRLQQMARQFNIRMEARVKERTRIARDLHDTLLQSFQGVLLKFHAVTFMMTGRPEVQKKLEDAIEQARTAIAEGRDAVQGLRTSTLVSNDLANSISIVGDGLMAEQPAGQAPEFSIQVEGTSRDLRPLVRDEVYRIATEAIRNAFRHAKARRIEVEIHYHRRELRLRIRDDGAGIDPSVLGDAKRPGHYGVPGMHERAAVISGKLTIWSELDSGAEVELTVPAAIAYAKSSEPSQPAKLL
jgi:signal transduction histidine kinase